jgi:hypothetical protein
MTDEEIEAEGKRCGQATIDAQNMLGESIRRIQRTGDLDRIATFFAAYMQTINMGMDAGGRRAFLAGVFAGIGEVTPFQKVMLEDLMDRIEEKLKGRQFPRPAKGEAS